MYDKLNSSSDRIGFKINSKNKLKPQEIQSDITSLEMNKPNDY